MSSTLGLSLRSLRKDKGENKRPRKKFNMKFLRNVGEHPCSEGASRRNRLTLHWKEHLRASDLLETGSSLRAIHGDHSISALKSQPSGRIIGKGLLEQGDPSFALGKCDLEPRFCYSNQCDFLGKSLNLSKSGSPHL